MKAPALARGFFVCASSTRHFLTSRLRPGFFYASSDKPRYVRGFFVSGHTELTDTARAMDRREWHLDKSLSVGHILTTVLILGALAVQYAQFSSRMAVLESAATAQGTIVTQLLDNQRRVDARQDAEMADMRREIRDSYTKILELLRERQ